MPRYFLVPRHQKYRDTFVDTTGWSKKTRPLYIFPNIKKTTEDKYNARCYSSCCLKWRYLVKFLPLDNAASKLKPNALLTVILTYAALCDVTQENVEWPRFLDHPVHVQQNLFNTLFS